MKEYLFCNPREIDIEIFHKAFGAAIQEEATKDLILLRCRLIEEEANELLGALALIASQKAHGYETTKADWINVLDGMADLQVVLSGTAVAIKQLRHFDVAFARVHESNMSKLGEDGKPILREDGKILKGPNYKPPILDDLID